MACQHAACIFPDERPNARTWIMGGFPTGRLRIADIVLAADVIGPCPRAFLGIGITWR